MSSEALNTIHNYFTLAYPEAKYFSAIFAALTLHGFTRDNTIALVNTCRDELSQPIFGFFDEHFGKPFILSGLGGVLTAGITGLQAGTSHSPIGPNGKEQYVFFASAHVAVDHQGIEGYVLRQGRPQPSKACGALVKINNEISICPDGRQATIEDDDVEYGYLKRKILSKLHVYEFGTNLTLFELTKLTALIITEDLENYIMKSVDTTKSNYAVLTAVQIHAGAHGGQWTPNAVVDYIAPLTSYVVVDGVKQELLQAQLESACSSFPQASLL